VLLGGYDQALTGEGKWFSFDSGDFRIRIKPLKPYDSFFDSKIPIDKLTDADAGKKILQRFKSQVTGIEGIKTKTAGVESELTIETLTDAKIFELLNAVVSIDNVDTLHFRVAKDDEGNDIPLPATLPLQAWIMRILSTPASFSEGEASATF